MRIRTDPAADSHADPAAFSHFKIPSLSRIKAATVSDRLSFGSRIIAVIGCFAGVSRLFGRFIDRRYATQTRLSKV
jgi:hypothetical protein